MFAKAGRDLTKKVFFSWTLVLLVVGSSSLLFCGKVGGEQVLNETQPGMLPPMDEFAEPMLPMTSFFEGRKEKILPSPRGLDLINELWAVMDLHRDGNVHEAIVRWKRIRLHKDAEVWRQVAIAAAHLKTGNVDAVVDVLEHAILIDPNNALVHYYWGFLFVAGNNHTSPTSGEPVRSTTSHTLEAIRELNKAIELADQIDLDQHLASPVVLTNRTWEKTGIGVKQAVVPVLPNGPFRSPLQDPALATVPTVGDLLVAIDADNFIAKAHQMLGPLYIERGMLTEAESHLDEAARLGMLVLDDYRELADAYDAREQFENSIRANLKATALGGGIEARRKALDSLRKAIKD